MATLDRTMSCLCCNTPVLISSATWSRMEAPAALCKHCYKTVPKSMINVLFIMRSQIETIHQDVTSVQKDIRRLYTAQQDYEQALRG